MRKKRKLRLEQHIPSSAISPMFQIVEFEQGNSYWHLKIKDAIVNDEPEFRHYLPKSKINWPLPQQVANAGAGELNEAKGLVTIQRFEDGIPVFLGIYASDGRSVYCLRSTDEDIPSIANNGISLDPVFSSVEEEVPPNVYSSLETEMKWSDSQRAQLLQIYKQQIDKLGEEEFFARFDEIQEEAHRTIEEEAIQARQQNNNDLLHLEDGRSFPQYMGEALSWEPGITLRDEEEGYPRLQAVLNALSIHRPERLEAIRRDCLKGYGDRVFGHQDIKLLKLIERFVPGLKQFPSELKPLDSLDYIDPIHSSAATLGRLGGSKKSEAKTLAVRENGKKGGRPKKQSTVDINLFD